MTDTCINPAEIELGDLLAYAEGSNIPHIETHVQQCAFCAVKVADYQALNQLFTARFYRYHCPSTQKLVDFSFDLLPAGEHTEVETHLKICSHCQQSLAELNTVAPVNPLTDVDAVQSKIGQVKEWLSAVLISQPLSAAPVRGAVRPGVLRYQVESIELTVGVQGRGQKVRLQGRLHSAGPLDETAGLPILLLQNQHLIAEQETNAIGGFAFADVPPGLYELAFRWQGQGIIIPEIEVLK